MNASLLPPKPVLYDLRNHLRSVADSRSQGSKVGCGEGGCGACTAIVDRLDAATGEGVPVISSAHTRNLREIPLLTPLVSDNILLPMIQPS